MWLNPNKYPKHINVQKEIDEEKKALGISPTLFLRSLDISKSEFTISGRIDAFWKDENLLQLFELKDEEYNIVKYTDLSTDLQKELPFVLTKYNLFDRTKVIRYLDDAVIDIHSNGVFHFNIPFEVTLAQKFDNLHRYPNDKHMLSIKLFYNQQKYKLEKLDEAYILQCTKSVNIPNLRQYISFSMDEFNEQQEWTGLSPWSSAAGDNYFYITLRIMRNPNYIRTRIILPLFIIISCTFSIYAFPYFATWIYRLFIIFLALIAVTIIHSIKESKRLFILMFTAYSVLAFLMIGSIITGLSAGKVDIEATDFIEIIFAFSGAVTWICCCLCHMIDGRYLGSDSTKEKYWRQAFSDSIDLSKPKFIKNQS